MIKIPEFPRFKSVDLHDKANYDAFYKQYEPYSDFNFNNLWIWFNQAGGLGIALHGNNLVIRLDDPFHNGASEFTFIGKDHCEYTAQRILRWQRSMGLEEKLVMVPEVSALQIKDVSFGLLIEEDIDNHDYIYDVEQLYEARGRTFMGFRNSVSAFKKQFAESKVECRILDLHDYSQCVTLINTLHIWDSTYRQDQQSIVEGHALNKCLLNSVELGVHGFGLYIDDILVAFAIYNLAPQGEYAMMNHVKCNNAIRHISDYMFHCAIKKFHDLGLKYENFEQDLGIDGLRLYKKGLRPCKFLKRYTVQPSKTITQHTNNQVYPAVQA